MPADDLVEREITLNRFKRLMSELARGEMRRNSFYPWEIDILLDLDCCQLAPRRRGDILRQYQRAVERQMECGPGPPMKLSDYLEARARKREEALRHAALNRESPGALECDNLR